jgi:hypothetical protein
MLLGWRGDLKEEQIDYVVEKVKDRLKCKIN